MTTNGSAILISLCACVCQREREGEYESSRLLVLAKKNGGGRLVNDCRCTYRQRVFKCESVAGESSHVWNMICALISFPRASCPTQMSAPLLHPFTHAHTHKHTLPDRAQAPCVRARVRRHVGMASTRRAAPLSACWSLHLCVITLLCLPLYLHQPHPPSFHLHSHPSDALLHVHLNIVFMHSSHHSFCLWPPSSLYLSVRPTSGYTMAEVAVVLEKRGLGGSVLLADLMSSSGNRTAAIKKKKEAKNKKELLSAVQPVLLNRCALANMCSVSSRDEYNGSYRRKDVTEKNQHVTRSSKRKDVQHFFHGYGLSFISELTFLSFFFFL